MEPYEVFFVFCFFYQGALFLDNAGIDTFISLLGGTRTMFFAAM